MYKKIVGLIALLFFIPLAVFAAFSVPQGGTGKGTLTSTGVLYGNGTSPIGVTSACSNGQIIKYAGGVPACGTDSSGIGGSIANTQIAFGSGTNTIQGSGNATLDSSGNGTFNFLKTTTSSQTQGQFGGTYPMYIIGNSPNLGMNAYYNNGGWLYGAGSSGNYGATMGFDQGSGNINYYISDGTGNADDPISFSDTWMSLSKSNARVEFSNSLAYITLAAGAAYFDGGVNWVNGGVDNAGNMVVAGNLNLQQNTLYHVSTADTSFGIYRDDGYPGAGQNYYFGSPGSAQYVGGWSFDYSTGVVLFSNDGSGGQVPSAVIDTGGNALFLHNLASTGNAILADGVYSFDEDQFYANRRAVIDASSTSIVTPSLVVTSNQDADNNIQEWWDNNSNVKALIDGSGNYVSEDGSVTLNNGDFNGNTANLTSIVLEASFQDGFSSAGSNNQVLTSQGSGTTTQWKTLDASNVTNAVADVATADLTTQSAAKTATTIFTPSATGMYRVSVYLQVTRAASTSSVLGGATGAVITYTDGDGSVAQTDTVALANTAGAIAISSATNTTATNLTGSLVIYAKTGVAIQYAIGYTSVGVTSMQYAAHLKVEKL